MKPESPYPMLAVADALAIVLAQSEPLPPVTVDLPDALGLVLAEDVRAREPLPPFRAAVKDGYAVVAADGPGVYPVASRVTAGRISGRRLEAGSVAYITTGAPVPAGADAVVMIEESEVVPPRGGVEQVRIYATAAVGQDIRPVGVDVQAGETVLRAGELLGPAEIGLLATVGAVRVACYPRPRVATLSTGDELAEPHAELAPGQIRDSNRAMLHAAIRQAGGTVVDLGISPDAQDQLEAAVQRGLRDADILLTSGGVSMGDLDLIKPLLQGRGQVHFGRIRMKPGKPLTFATIQVDGEENDGNENAGMETGGRRRLIFGLPGNPVSSLVTFYLLALPALRKLAGRSQPELRRVQAQLAQPLALDPARPEYHRATLGWDAGLNEGRGGYLAVSTGAQASSRLLSMRSANALLELPQADGHLPAGALVDALVIGELNG